MGLKLLGEIIMLAFSLAGIGFIVLGGILVTAPIILPWLRATTDEVPGDIEPKRGAGHRFHVRRPIAAPAAYACFIAAATLRAA